MNKQLKPFSTILLLPLGVAWLFTPNVFSDLYPQPPQAKDLMGAWVGCAYDCLEFYRLDLMTKNSGSLVRIDFDSTVSVYDAQWAVEGDKLLMTVKPRAQAQPIVLKSVGLHRKFLTFHIEGESGWQRTLTLFNERDWERRRRIAEKAPR